MLHSRTERLAAQHGNMSSQNQGKYLHSEALIETLLVSVKNGERMAKMMRDLMQENKRLREELRKSSSIFTGAKSEASEVSRELCACKQKLGALAMINHTWKQDYEHLETRYKMVVEEKEQLEYEKENLKELVNRLGSLDESRQARFEEQCELLKSQARVYVEDFELEKKDREKIEEESEIYKRKLNDAERNIRKLTAQLDACCTALVEAYGERENVYHTPLPQPRFIHPYHPVDETRQLQSLYGEHPASAAK